MSIDIKNFYLNTPMSRYEYMRLKIAELPQDFIDEYKLQDKKTKDGYVYLETRKGMYGLLQAGILAQKLLEKRLNTKGYWQSGICPGFWKHGLRPICFSLCVDSFTVKYVDRQHAEHIINSFKQDMPQHIWTPRNLWVQQHGTGCPQRCLLHLRDQGTKPRRRSFLHGHRHCRPQK